MEYVMNRQDGNGGTGDAPEGRTAVPNADVIETPDAYVLMLDLPGARKESIALRLENGTLEVEAAVEEQHAGDARVLYREIRSARYRRSFALGDGVDRNNVDAEYADGVLRVKLLKTPESKPTTIPIN